MHDQFSLDWRVVRLTGDGGQVTVGWQFEGTLMCSQCGAEFIWIGPTGRAVTGPAVSVDGDELRAPVLPRATGKALLDQFQVAMRPATVGEA